MATPGTAGRKNGSPKTGGRKKGTPNIVNRDIKEMALRALSEAGGHRYLLEQSQNNPTAFMGLLGKVIPKEITIDLNARFSEMSLEEKQAEARRMAIELGLMS